MKQNPILEEIWQTKDELARESGYDVHRFFEKLRQWESEHPHSGPVVRNADELREAIVKDQRNRSEAAAAILNDKPPATKS